MTKDERKKQLQALIDDPHSTAVEREEAARELNDGEPQPAAPEAVSDSAIAELEALYTWQLGYGKRPTLGPAAQQLQLDLAIPVVGWGPGYDYSTAVDRLAALHRATTKAPGIREDALAALKSLVRYERSPESQAKAKEVLAELGVVVEPAAKQSEKAPQPAAGPQAPEPVPAKIGDTDAGGTRSAGDASRHVTEEKLSATAKVSKPRPVLVLGKAPLPPAETRAELNEFFRRARRGDPVGQSLIKTYRQKSFDGGISLYARWLDELLDWCCETGQDVKLLPGELSESNSTADGNPGPGYHAYALLCQMAPRRDAANTAYRDEPLPRGMKRDPYQAGALIPEDSQ